MSGKRRHSRPKPLNLRTFSSGIIENAECLDFGTPDNSLLSRSSMYNSGSSPIPSPSTSRPSSPRGNLALLASRRSSRDSQGATTNNVDDDGGSISPVPSLRNSYRCTRRRPSNFLELPDVNYLRPRVCSLPEGSYNPRTGRRDNIYRLRKFSITNKGVVNCGDKILPKRSPSNISMGSLSNSRQSNLNDERSPLEGGSYCGDSSAAISSEDETNENNNNKFRIVLLGAAGVGKSSLLTQFMTSEYINTYDASLDDQFGERNVLVNLEDKESELVFIDHPTSEMSVENSISTYEPHAAIVVYSVTDRSSFRFANDVLRYLWQEGITQEKAVILVGNKCDLARARVTTSQEGKALACAHDCKFIETSSGIQHNVDELLVGSLKQCRLRAEKLKHKKIKQNNSLNKKNGGKKSSSSIYSSKTSLSLHLAKEILGKLCLQSSKSKSCENLHVL